MSCNLICLKTAETSSFENAKVKELLHEAMDIILQILESISAVLSSISILNKGSFSFSYKNKGQLHTVLYASLNELFDDFNSSRSWNN